MLVVDVLVVVVESDWVLLFYLYLHGEEENNGQLFPIIFCNAFLPPLDLLFYFVYLYLRGEEYRQPYFSFSFNVYFIYYICMAMKKGGNLFQLHLSTSILSIYISMAMKKITDNLFQLHLLTSIPSIHICMAMKKIIGNLSFYI